MYKIKIELKFRAGHRLLPPYKGKCNNVHGEGYTAIIEFKREALDENDMLLDFGDIKRQIKTWIDDNWDHAYIHNPKDGVADLLKDCGMKTFDMGFYGNPTAENMAKFLYNIIKTKISYLVCKVGIVESFEDSVAWYEEDEDD